MTDDLEQIITDLKQEIAQLKSRITCSDCNGMGESEGMGLCIRVICSECNGVGDFPVSSMFKPVRED